MRLLSFLLIGSAALISSAAANPASPVHHHVPSALRSRQYQAPNGTSFNGTFPGFNGTFNGTYPGFNGTFNGTYPNFNFTYPNGTYYNIQNYTNNLANFDFEDGEGGNWAVTWKSAFGGDFVVGKGYQPNGGTFNYSGTYEPDSGANSYLALYGWGTNPTGDVPTVEWYIIESMGVHNPSDNASATQYGVLESDGATYEIWMKPNYDGTDSMPFHQYWSIRTSMHCGGTITYANHWAAWNEVGLGFAGAWEYALSIEGQSGGGHANLTVGVLPSTKVAETPTSTRRSVGGTKLPKTTETLTSPYTEVLTTTSPPSSSSSSNPPSSSSNPPSSSSNPPSSSNNPPSSTSKPPSSTTHPTSSSSHPTSSSSHSSSSSRHPTTTTPPPESETTYLVLPPVTPSTG